MTLHARQFIVAPHAFESADLASSERFGELHVRFTPDLELCTADFDDRQGMLIGNAISPAVPDLTNHQIIRQLLRENPTFEQLQRSLSALGGRWVLLCRIGSEIRLYPDAGGTRSVYYSDDGRIASQPRYFGGALNASLRQYPRAGAWPLGYTPYKGVRQLLPNHFLDMSRWRSVRFGPNAIPRRDVGFAVRRISELLRGTIDGVVSRGKAALPLTGGFDSRTLLSAARGPSFEKIELFSIIDRQTERHDYVLPQILARRVAKPLQFVDAERSADVELNTWGMFHDPNLSRISAFARAEIVLLGHLSEITRCFYWKDGVAPEVTADKLSRLAGFDGALVEVFEQWLGAVPVTEPGSILDLFYWECRAGNWASNCCTTLDQFCNVISPYNCRDLLETGLGVDVSHRCQPFDLHRRLCSPDLAELDFNATPLERLESRLPKWIPWRLRNRMLHVGRPPLG